MRRSRTVLKYLGLLLLLLILIIALTLVYFIRSPFPKTSGKIKLDGLSAEVTIQRDDLGVAHIYAENTEDLFFAQGYTHAQDRFWQMEFWRHIGMGRLSEIVGEPTLETDLFIRNMGWNRIAEASTENYRQNNPELWGILEAYSAGVNAWIADNGDNISFNQRILKLSAGEWEIEPWQPVHTVAWGTVMAWDLRGSSNISSEQTWAELEAALGRDVVEGLIPDYPDNRPIIVPSTASSQTPFESDSFVALREQFEMIGREPDNGFALGSGPFVGSNSWVVAGEHTNTGAPLLADDPHLSVQMPSIWYWNSLHAPGWDVTGMSFAGVPGVVIGHNADIAWGVTNMGADSQDVYIEKLNPDNPLQYEFEGEWLDMNVIEEEIKVNGGESVMLEVHETRHGPLLNSINEDLEQALAAKWTAFTPSRLFQAVIELNRASNYAEFRSALSKWDTSPQNFVYADTEGNIAYQSTGFYPIRRGWQGTQPVPGWTGEFEWDGFIPYDEMPRILNPESGYIVTANNAIVDADYPYYLARNWASGDRSQRITDLLEAQMAKGKVSAETFQTIQADNYDMLAASYQPLLTGLTSDDPVVQEAIERMRGWDGQLSTNSVPATIFEAFLWKLAEQVLLDDVGDQADNVIGNGSTMRVLLHELAADPDNRFWDDSNTDAVEDQQMIMLQAIEEAVAFLQDKFGKDSAEWNWGNVHQITFASNPLGESGIGPLESIVNRGPFPIAGGGSIINATSFNWDDSFADVSWHPSMRMITDLSDFDNSLAIHPTGQSGHPFNKHYDDMIELWSTVQYHDFVFSSERIDEMTKETLTLKPR